MLSVFDTADKFFNHLVKTNGINPSWMTNKRDDSIPISNKYFITVFDQFNEHFSNFINYISDDTRNTAWEFGKEDGVDYSLMIEPEQLSQIDLSTQTLNDISKQLDLLFEIVNESDGQIVLVFDIGHLISNYIGSKEIGQPNHLIELLLYKLKNELSEVCILNNNNFISNKYNMLCAQFELCIKGNNQKNLVKYNFDKYVLVYKNTSDDIETNPYWNLFYPQMKISKLIGKIPSPIRTNKKNNNSDSHYDSDSIRDTIETNQNTMSNNDFDIVEINNKECFAYKLNLPDHIDENLLNIKNEIIILIDPLDRLNVFL